MGHLTAIISGSAAGGAFPQWNCRCPVCQLAWTGDPRVRPRTQAGIAVTANDGRWTLINASPDLAAQIRTTPALHPRNNLRGSPIDAVVRTGAEIDQVAGLLSLRGAHCIYALCNAGRVRGSRRQCHVRCNERDDAARDQPRRTLRVGGWHRCKFVHGAGQVAALPRRRNCRS